MKQNKMFTTLKAEIMVMEIKIQLMKAALDLLEAVRSGDLEAVKIVV